MITSLNIKNFKSHDNTLLDCSYLNILAGLNGTGKSSVIQALLLLRQSYLKNRLEKGMDLNQPLCSIGQATDAFYQFGNSDNIEFAITFDNEKVYPWKFKYEKPDTTFLSILESPDIKDLHLHSLFNSDFQYLSAGRLSPQGNYVRDNYGVEQERQLSSVLGKGELVAHFLNYFGTKPIIVKGIKHPANNDNTIREQTNAWLREISKNIIVQIVDNRTSFEIKYQFMREDQAPPTEPMKAENVGFGITYVLPIIAAIISANKNSLLLIENPESHLHPAGQAELVKLMALAAQNGVQIFLETHSDHIINGTLVAAKRFEDEGTGIDRNKVRIYYFDRDEKRHCSEVHAVPVHTGGRIKNPPRGFFDQFKIDMKFLMGF